MDRQQSDGLSLPLQELAIATKTDRPKFQPVYESFGSPPSTWERTQKHAPKQTTIILKCIEYCNNNPGKIYKQNVLEYIKSLTESDVLNTLEFFGRSKEKILLFGEKYKPEEFRHLQDLDLYQFLSFPYVMIEEEIVQKVQQLWDISELAVEKREEQIKSMQDFFDQIRIIWREAHKKNDGKTI